MRAFLSAVREGGVLFDGAMGSLLYERGVYLTHCFENICLSQPALVKQIHAGYLQAGAQVISTNSFGANRIKLARHGLAEHVEAINRAAAQLAQQVASGQAWIAGSVGPSGLGLYDIVGAQGPRVRAAFEEQIRALAGSGVDLILLETFSHLLELELAIEVAQRCAPGLPVVALFTFQTDGRSNQGHTPQQIAVRLVAAGVDVIGANCGGGPDLIYRVATQMLGAGRPVMAAPNAGRPEHIEDRTIYVANPEYLGVFARRFLKAGVQVIGGCCGTNPEHIRRMASAVRMMRPGRAVVEATGEEGEDRRRPAVPWAQRSAWAAALAQGRFARSVEINPPMGLDLSRQVEAARLLKAAGVDAMNIADGPRASARMGNLAMAVQVQREAQLETILHVCTRDRSLLGLVAHLLGAHVLGIRNLVVVTGDPPKLGPYPHSSGVYDVDSIGLLRIIDGMNHGVDPGGQLLPEPTAFFPMTGAEPAAVDYEREIRRLRLKKEAGAQAVMTQPVYDPALVARFLDDAAALELPVLLGVLPLASYRNAIFLHENVPGMRVPEAVLARMRAADERGQGRAEGLAIAREAIEAVRDRIQGVYVMPPFGRAQLAVELLESVGA